MQTEMEGRCITKVGALVGVGAVLCKGRSNHEQPLRYVPTLRLNFFQARSLSIADGKTLCHQSRNAGRVVINLTSRRRPGVCWTHKFTSFNAPLCRRPSAYNSLEPSVEALEDDSVVSSHRSQKATESTVVFSPKGIGEYDGRPQSIKSSSQHTMDGSEPLAPAPENISVSQGKKTPGSIAALDSNEKGIIEDSLTMVMSETKACYDLVETLGRGLVYMGSARIPEQHVLFQQCQELSYEAALLLGSTSWSGVGPGAMEASIRGALQAGRQAAGFKIVFEAGQAPSYVHPRLPENTYLVCKSISARKQGLINAGIRTKPNEKTAFVALPGGVGTIDELSDVLALMQLKQLGSTYPVPFLLMNYDGCYDGLLSFLKDLESFGALAKGEVNSLWTVCSSNFEALEHLANFYNIAPSERGYRDRV
eukprot:jgi/Mesen1/7218/ME000371S06285